MEHTKGGKQHLRVRLSWPSLQLIQYKSNEVYYEENLFFFNAARPADMVKQSGLYHVALIPDQLPNKQEVFFYFFSSISLILKFIGATM